MVELSTHAGDKQIAQVDPRWSTLEELLVPSTSIRVVVLTISACQTTHNTTALVTRLNLQQESMEPNMKQGAAH